MSNYYYNNYFNFAQQIINFNLYQIGLPEDDAVYTLMDMVKHWRIKHSIEEFAYISEATS